MDINSHLKHLLRLIQAERNEEADTHKRKLLYTDVHDRVKQGISWYPVVLSRHYTGTGERMVVEVERTGQPAIRHSFQGGASVSLFCNQSEQKDLSVTGVIAYVRDTKMKVVLNMDNLPEWINDGKLGVNLAYDESSFREMEGAVKQVMKAGANRLGELRDTIYGASTPRFEKPLPVSFPILNEDQNKALQKAIAAKDIALVHGPPGTGKTTTLVQAIKYTVDIEKQVLVCTPSNASVDLLVEKLVDQGLDVLRIGHPARISDVAVSSSLDERIANHASFKDLKAVRKKSVQMRDTAMKYKRSFGPSERQQRKLLLQEVRYLRDEADLIERYIVQSLLDSAQVVLSTLAGSNHRLLKSKTFKTLFIDEAGQSLEPACWIPIQKAERVIMAGDHQQLPPTVKSQEAMREGLAYTLFERLMKEQSVDVMLTLQYRMHPDIMDFPSQQFYKGALKADESVLSRGLLTGANVEFVDTAGCGFDEQVNEQTLSTYNPDEAALMARHMGLLLSENTALLGSEEITIGVIAPYRAQVEYLENNLEAVVEQFDISDRLSVNTVDSFQGQERDIIYISLTRSNDKGEIGFLKNIKRMNVAMTRAKRKLVIIGDSATLGGNDFFNAMIDHFQDKAAYKSAFEYLYSD
ncbi:MAG: AAA domain-containing protein [Cyclobacteriaceae bacterium]